MRIFFFFTVILFATLLSPSEGSQIVDDCVSLGYENCLSQVGSCTVIKSECQPTCNSASDCFTNCCFQGYCVFSNTGLCQNTLGTTVNLSPNSSTSSISDSAIVAIVTTCSILGVLILLGIITCCWYVRYRQRVVRNQENQNCFGGMNRQNHLEDINLQMNDVNNQYPYNLKQIQAADQPFSKDNCNPNQKQKDFFDNIITGIPCQQIYVQNPETSKNRN